jgi:NAD(P)-dependent dehydrogenase (short-subunit alcohol dehydrogenase family)
MEKPVALVTGSARGIGRGIAEKLAQHGFDLVIDDVHGEAEEMLFSLHKLGADAIYVQADISDAGARHRLLHEIKTCFGRLDMLVNNAGVAPKVRMDILEASEESFDRVMTINLKGPYFLTQAVATWMIDQKKAFPDRNYRIVNLFDRPR